MTVEKDKIMFNGPQTKLSREFIWAIEGRLDERPWTPSQEVSVMRALNVVARQWALREIIELLQSRDITSRDDAIVAIISWGSGER